MVKFLKYIVYIIISILVSNYLLNIRIENFYFKEFFLNYSDGFLRRAIDGEILFLISKKTLISPLYIVPVISSFFLITFFFLIFKFIRKHSYTSILIFSMPVLLGEIIHNSIFRKDIPIIILLLINMVVLFKIKNYLIKYILHVLICSFSILFHEIYFLISFIPFCIIFFLSSQKKMFFSSFIITFLLFLLMSKFSGLHIDQNEIINSWNKIDINVGKYISNLNKILKVKITIFYKTNNYSLFSVLFFFSFFFANFYLIVGYVYSYICNERKKFFIIFCTIFYPLVLLLCAIAVDFSRWFFMINLIMIIFPHILPNDYIMRFNKLSLNLNIEKYSILIKNKYFPIAYFFLGMPFFGFWTPKEYMESTPLYTILSIFFNFN